MDRVYKKKKRRYFFKTFNTGLKNLFIFSNQQSKTQRHLMPNDKTQGKKSDIFV